MLLSIITRSLAIYFVVLLVMRIMGKREIGQLSTFDLVVALIIAELAAIPLSMDIPFLRGILPIVVITFTEVLISYLCLKIDFLRDLIYGKPTVIIKNGKINDLAMKKSRYNIEDLLMQLREKNISNIADVEFAVLESSGDLTVIPKSQKRPATPEDLKIPTEYEGLCIPLIIDGRIKKENLKQAGLNEKKLQEELANRGIKRAEEVFFASIDTRGRLYTDLKDKKEK